jgi:uncharacterized membrane protein YphA (DoxX/SURF4 family)
MHYQKHFDVMKNPIISYLFPSVQPQGFTFELAYALFRFYCGISIALGAGLAKVFHKIDEASPISWSNIAFGAPAWFIKQVGEIGFTVISPSFWAYLAIYGEFIGGLLIALGLFTRISALQMAFQFFVVSFIWYDSPVPFAMYYQQLIFWSFVLIAAVGSGRFSIDHWIQNHSKQFGTTNQMRFWAIACLLLVCCEAGQAQGIQNVPFVVKNGGFSAKSIEMKHFDYQTRKISGYGLDLGSQVSEAVNLPAGTRIYAIKKGRRQLLTIIQAQDAGSMIDISTDFEPTREQWLSAAYDEMNEKAAERTAPNPALELLAAQYGMPLIPLVFRGRDVDARTVHLRMELPFEGASKTMGFSQSLSCSLEKYVAWPIGTRVYLCDGPFWDSASTTNEKLLFIVDAEKANYSFEL